MKSQVQAQLESIVNLDIEPKVFRVNLRACDHTAGFTCYLDFRSNDRSLSNIVTHGDTPENALSSMYSYLINKFGKCEYCGRVGPRELE